MARRTHGRSGTLVNISTYSDDPAYPIGSNEWNENPKTDGVLGFTKGTEAIASNALQIEHSLTEVTNAGDIRKLFGKTTENQALDGSNFYGNSSTKSIAEGDCVYLIKANGVGTVTLKHQYSGITEGRINTLNEGDTVLDENVPVILFCRNKDAAGNLEWFEYGGGVVADLGITTAKLAADAVTGAKIADDTIDSEHYIAASIDNEHLANDAVGADELAADAVVNASVASGAAIATSKISGALTSVASHGLAASATTDTTNADNIGSGTLAAARVATLNQNTTGTAAIATTVTCADNAANETVYPTFVDGATGAQDLETDTGLNYNPSTGLLSAVGLTLSGNLTVSGTTTTINSTTLTVDDKNIEMGSVDTPSDTTADGGGITLKGATDKTLIWDNANDNWTSNQDWNIATGKVFKVNNVSTLTATALGSAVVGSSLTSVGTLTGLTMGGALAMGGNDITNGGVIFLTEQAEAENDIAGKGQIWVDTQTPNKLYFTDDAGNDTDLTAGGGDTFGAQQFWCDGGAFIPTPSSTVGTATSYGQTRTLSNGVSLSSLVLPKNSSIDSRCTFTWTPPENWNAGTILAKIYWTMQDTTTTSVGDTGAFEVSAVAISNDDTLNASFGTAVAVTDVFIATNDLHVATISGAITVGGSPANADLVQIQINRNAGSDTLEAGSNVELLGIILEYTQDASTSSG